MTSTPFASVRLHQVWIHLSKKKGWVSRRVPISLNKKTHWAVKYKWTKAWQREVYGIVLENKKQFGKLPLEGRPTIEIILAQIQPMDRDNAYGACKPIIDGLKVPRRLGDIGAGVIVDDNEESYELIVRSRRVTKIEEEGVTINFYR